MIDRSYLFVPGNRPERFEKARRAGADVVVIDLEDAVGAADKPAARSAAASWLGSGGAAYVRLNGPDSDRFEGDLALLTLPGIRGVLLPKAESRAQIEAVGRAAPGTLPLIALIESGRGLWAAMELATAPGVARLAFGSIDFQLDLGIDGERDELLHARSQLVLVSRVAGLPAPIDGVTTALGDPRALDDDIRHARRLGFGGKLCIHPRQVATVNAGFLPGPDEVLHAQRVVAAAEAAHGNVARVEGRMIDRPVIERARAVLESAGRGTRAPD